MHVKYLVAIIDSLCLLDITWISTNWLIKNTEKHFIHWLNLTFQGLNNFIH